jgi:hypothetical protein
MMAGPNITVTNTVGPNSANPVTLQNAQIVPGSQIATIAQNTSGAAIGINSSNGVVFRPLLARIKASIAAAERANPVTSLPWMPIPACNGATPANAVRANSFAYATYTCFTNAAGTHNFVVRSAGTSAASEPAAVTNPTTTLNGQGEINYGDITDGTAVLQWIGPTRVTSAQAGAPSVYTGPVPTGLTAQSLAPNVPSAAPYPYFYFSGGSTYLTGNTSTGTVYAFSSATTSGNRAGQAPTGQNIAYAGTADTYVTFMTDAPLIALDLVQYAAANAGTSGTGAFYYVEIDDRRLCDGTISVPVAQANGQGYIILDWRQSGGRQPRKIRIGVLNGGGGGFFNFGGMNQIWLQKPQDSIWQPKNPNRYFFVADGCSTMNNSASGPLMPGFGRAFLTSLLLGTDNYANLSQGGTGFIATGSSGLNYAGRIPFVQSLNPDVYYITDNINDAGSSAAAQQASVVSYCQQFRAALPNTILILGGCFAYGASNSIATETNMQAGYNTYQSSANDPLTFFAPSALDVPPWITGSGTIQSPNSTGNTDYYIGPTDSEHPGNYAIIKYLPYKDSYAIKNVIVGLS